MTKSVWSNQGLARAWSMNCPIAKSVYWTAPSRLGPEGTSMRPAGHAEGRGFDTVLTGAENGLRAALRLGQSARARLNRAASGPSPASYQVIAAGVGAARSA